MKTQVFSLTPDYSPVIKMMEMQTRLAMETSQAMMKLALLPWQGLPVPKVPMGFASICAPTGTTPAPEAVKEPVVRVEAVADAVVETPLAETAPEVSETVAEVAEEPVIVTDAAPAPVAEAVIEETTPAPAAAAEIDESAPVAPKALKGPKGDADDLTTLNGVGPKLAETLNEAGIYHFSQIAKWSDANVAWIDSNVAGVRGRASRNGWVAQAADLAQ